MEDDGDVLFDDGFTASGEVWILDASIQGSLHCARGRFENPGAVALSADRVKIGGDLRLNEEFVSEGAVRLLGASIGGALDCSGGSFRNRGHNSFNADVATSCRLA